MKIKTAIGKSLLMTLALAAAIATTFMAGCATKNDTISQAEKMDKTKPGIAEIKAIAEEGFIYGLPIVMNYAVMYEYAVDKQLRPVQGAVQPDQQRSPRLHLQGYGGHHAQQRYAVFHAVAGPAG